MNHKKVKKQINKINSFFDSITADDEISKIEKDLLLSYIRKLYETVIDEASPSPSEKTTHHEKPIKTETSDLAAQAKVEAVEEVIEAPVIIERKPFEKAIVAETPKVTAEKLAPAPTAEALQAVSPSSTVAEVIDVAPQDLSDNMIFIFEQDSGNEISDRLGNLPIKDLTKSMGINERMFTVKELFGGDQELMKKVLNDLNGMKNFEDAKSYLIGGVAKDLEWDSSSKYKKASNFVKLVQRRYS